MYPLTIGSVIQDKSLEEQVERALQELPVRNILNDPEIFDWTSFLSRLDRLRPDVLIVDLTNLREPAEQVIRRIRASSASPAVVALHKATDPETILAMIRAGASEYLYPPIEETLRRALENISEQKERQQVRSTARARSFAFLSAKGGCGATTIVCHAAADVARLTNQQVLLADLDLHSGLVGFIMKTKSDYSLLDAAKNLYRLDLSFWKALVSNGLPGLEIISAPAAFTGQEGPSPDEIRQILRFAKSNYDWTMADLGRGLNRATMEAIEELDECFLVTTLDVGALHQCKSVVRTLLSSGYPANRLHILLNRMPKNPEVTIEEIESMLGVPVYHVVPNDYSALYESSVEGSLLPPTAKLAQNLSGLAAKIGGVEEAPKKTRRFSLFGG